MDTSQIFLLFLLSAFASAANILRNEEAVVCDPAEDPSSCPTNRRCEDEDGDGEYNCVCDKRFYTTHTLGHCVLGFKELVFDMEKELAALEMKQEHDVDWLNETLVDLLEIPTTTTTTLHPDERPHQYWSISNAQSMYCSPCTNTTCSGGERHPEPGWRVGDLKFYSDVDCTNEISNGVAMSSKPWSGHSAEQAFDGDYNTDWRSDLFKRDLDFLWIGQNFTSSVHVKCISLYNGYNCGGKDSCTGMAGWHNVNSVNLKYSDDGVTWTKLETLTGFGCEGPQTSAVQTPAY